jgi:hypothetical protein
MAEHKDCKHYDGCDYRNDIGCCPNWCAQFKHKDDVRVVRCKDCRFIIDRTDGTHGCYRHFVDDCNHDDFCSYGERRTDG